MASVSPVASAAQYGLQQLQLQQAQRNAEQAELTARELKVQANNAQRVAERAKEDARGLAVRADQADSRAGQARQGVAALRSAESSATQLSRTVAQAQVAPSASTLTVAAPTATASSAPTPTINALGQVTGTTVNTTA